MQTKLLRTALMAAGAMVFVAGTANAQDYDRGYDNPSGYASPNEDVHVAAPRYDYGRGKLRMRNMRVFLSREVRYDDLDLRTRSGARTLRNRVRLTARLLCRDIDLRWPVTPDNGGDGITCFHNAAETGLYRANRAIHDARSYYD